MMINKTRTANIVLASMAALLFTACGLKDDLYIPTKETEVTPADAQSTDDENTEEDPGQLSEQAP